jgi:WD40-like Beta Propeller Repeat
VGRVPATRWICALGGLIAALSAAVGLADPLAAQPGLDTASDVLAFSRPDGALALAAEDGSGRLELASPRGGEIVSHSWSPDGRRLAFIRCRGRNCADGSVSVIAAEGTGERLVAPRAGGAVWLRDGKHLLVEGTDRPGRWVVAVASGSRRKFSAPGLTAAPVGPRLSPDGRWLLHLTRPYGRLIPNPYAPHHARARNWLLATDLATGRSRRISNQRGWYAIGTAPWAPGGSRFTFTRRSYLQAPGGRILVTAPDTPALQVVASGARQGGAWSPDGARLAFNTDDRCTIRVVTVDATAPARTLPFKGCLPTWRPSKTS